MVISLLITRAAVRARPREPFFFFSLPIIALHRAWHKKPIVTGSSVRDLGEGHSYMYEAILWDGQCMSEFGGRTDVQQIRVIAVVMITVLQGSARGLNHYRDSGLVLRPF
jgi:hypothetical protein